MSEPSITDWVGALSSATSALGIVIGFFFAKSQLNVWRQEARSRRRSEVAEELIIAAHNASDALRSVRSSFDQIPLDKVGDKTYLLQKRYKQLVDQNELFTHLRQAQIRANAVLGIDAIEMAVSSIFSVRNTVSIAIESLVEVADENDNESGIGEFKKKMRADLFGSYDESDKIGTRQLQAIETVEKILRPIARLETR